MNAVVAIGDITLDEKTDCKDVGEFVEVAETNDKGQISKIILHYGTLLFSQALKKRQRFARTKKAASQNGSPQRECVSPSRQTVRLARRLE